MLVAATYPFYLESVQKPAMCAHLDLLFRDTESAFACLAGQHGCTKTLVAEKVPSKKNTTFNP